MPPLLREEDLMIRPSLFLAVLALALSGGIVACTFPDATHDPGARHPTPAASNNAGGSGVSGESYTGKEPPPAASAR
jgi:hypothetical protein